MKLKNKLGMKERGSVLVIALILVSIAAVVTASSMRGSLMQEKMVSNQSSKSTAFMAAESGAASFSQWVNDPNTVWGSNSWQNIIPTSAEGKVNIGTQGYYWINPSDVVWGPSSVTLKIRGYTKSDTSSSSNGQTILQITMTQPSSSTAAYIGSPGMTAGGNINFTGVGMISGNVRTNADVNITGVGVLSNGTVMAAGSVKSKGFFPTLVTSKVDTMAIPVVTPAFLAKMSSKASVQSCNLNLSGDQGGKIYYCNGDLTLKGSFSNATIVSSGKVTNSGAGLMGGGSRSKESIAVAIVAAGNLTINGLNSDNAVYWTNGNVVQNGLNAQAGAIVAGGSITWNGGYNFNSNGNIIDNDEISTTATSSVSRLTAWQEVLQ